MYSSWIIRSYRKEACMALKRVCDRNVKACQTCTNEVSRLELQEQSDIFSAPTGVESPVCSSVWYSFYCKPTARVHLVIDIHRGLTWLQHCSSWRSIGHLQTSSTSCGMQVDLEELNSLCFYPYFPFEQQIWFCTGSGQHWSLSLRMMFIRGEAVLLQSLWDAGKCLWEHVQNL